MDFEEILDIYLRKDRNSNERTMSHCNLQEDQRDPYERCLMPPKPSPDIAELSLKVKFAIVSEFEDL